MKKQIRNGVFETNSSSMHSIIVTKNDVHIKPEEMKDRFNYLYVDKNGVLDLRYSEISEGYGRSPFQLLFSFKDKLMYCMCHDLGYIYATNPEFSEIISKYEDICKKYIEGFKKFDLYTHEIMIYKDKNGNVVPEYKIFYDDDDEGKLCYYSDNEIIFINEDDLDFQDVPDIGMIDHQSQYLLDHVLKQENIDVEEFLTNKKYVIVIDGDEYMKFTEIENSILWNKNNVVRKYTV